MKYRSLKKWENVDKLEGLVFFAQLLEELLFHYSLDTYKPSALNTSSLCLELRGLLIDVENDLIDQANITHVVEELVTSLKRDKVVEHLIDLDIPEIEARLTNEAITLKEKKIILRLLYAQIHPEKYKNAAEELLVQAVKIPRNKNDIRHLTRTYVTTLIDMGYTTKYLHASSGYYFHGSKTKINNAKNINGFFKLVNGNDQSYTVVFRASNMFQEMAAAENVFGLRISEKLPLKLNKLVADKNYQLRENETYIVIESLEAKDVYAARSLAGNHIERLATMINMFHHKQVPTWDSYAVVINEKRSKARRVRLEQNPMLLCADSRMESAASKLSQFLKEFNLEEIHSYQRYFNAAELHSLALKNDSPQNQLLNLWMGLETLAPSKVSKNKAKINNVIDSAMPYISLSYIPTLTNRLVQDFLLWDKSEFLASLNEIEGVDNRSKLLNLLLLEKHDDKKVTLYGKLGDFHLLRNRAHYFSDSLSSTGKIKVMLRGHSQRVAWQIRRIYRARNLIVHAGRTPSYIDVLIKNTHDYLDIVTGGIAKQASMGDKINSLDQAFKFTEMKHVSYIKRLENEDLRIDQSNIDYFVLGGPSI